MRAVIQRVLEATVKVNDKLVGQIGKGLLVYLSVGKGDTLKDAEFMADKLVNLRIFADEAGKMNRSVIDIGGQILLVSNFTLHGEYMHVRSINDGPVTFLLDSSRLF